MPSSRRAATSGGGSPIRRPIWSSRFAAPRRPTRRADALTRGAARPDAAGLGRTGPRSCPHRRRTTICSARSHGVTGGRRCARRSTHDEIARSPLDIARLLAARYPAAPSISYIPALAWINTLKLSALTGDDALRAKVLARCSHGSPARSRCSAIASSSRRSPARWCSRSSRRRTRPMRRRGRSRSKARDAALKEKAGGLPQYGQGWTDDMFMASAVLARTAAMPGRGRRSRSRRASC